MRVRLFETTVADLQQHQEVGDLRSFAFYAAVLDDMLRHVTFDVDTDGIDVVVYGRSLEE